MIRQAKEFNIRRMALLGNHVPRQCGIATFTSDLNDAIRSEFPNLDCFVVAMNDGGRQYAYPPTVRFEIAEAELPVYVRAADYLNVNEVEILCVQHEYGIFGGKAGSHVLALLRELRMPMIFVASSPSEGWPSITLDSTWMACSPIILCTPSEVTFRIQDHSPW